MTSGINILQILSSNNQKELQASHIFDGNVTWDLKLDGSLADAFNTNVIEQCNILHASVVAKNYTVLQEVVNHSPDLALRLNKNNQLPIHLACILGDYISIGLLSVSTGAAINTKDNDNHCPGYYALLATERIPCFVELLRNSLINYDISEETSKSLLELADDLNVEDVHTFLKFQTERSSDNLEYTLSLLLRKKVCTFTKEVNLLLDDDHDENMENQKIKCYCGLETVNHEVVIASRTSVHQWTSKDIVEIANNCHGEIEFSGSTNSAKYARLSDDTPEADVEKLLFNAWNLEKPNLIISIYGSEVDNTHFRNTWQKGLWKAAGGPGSWIITDGHSELAKLSGKAIKEFADAYGEESIHSLGICSWYKVANKEVLESHDYKGCLPAVYDATATASTMGSYKLDGSHSLFLMNDSGAIDDKLKENTVRFRSKLEKQLKISSKQHSSANFTLPMCIMLSGGGWSCLNEIYSAFIVNESPMIIIKGTGGLADIISNLIMELLECENKQKKGKQSSEDIMAEDKLKNLMFEVWELPLSTNLNQDVVMLVEIIRKRDLIEIFSLEEDAASDLDAKILSTLLNSAKTNDSSNSNQHAVNLDKLRITMSLDRSDVAKDKVFSENNKWKGKELDSFMQEALLMDKVNFVKLFLQEGFNMDTFLTIERLEELYQSSYNENSKRSAILGNLLDNEIKYSKSRSIILEDIGKVIEKLLGTFYKPLYLTEKFKNRYDRTKTSMASFQNSFASRNQFNMHEFQTSPKLDRPARELFIWSLLTQKMELAELFWTFEKESIGPALFAAMLLRQMKEYSGDISEKEELHEIASMFEDKALGVLDECYKDDIVKAQEILVRELVYYGETTCFVLAAEGNSIKFISQRCCQELLDLIWKGKLADKGNGSLKFAFGFICGIVFPFIIPFLVRYKYDTDDKTQHNSIKKYKKALNAVDSELGSPKKYRKKCMTGGEYFSKITDFYLAPMVRFIYNTISYVLFLLLFSYVTLFLMANHIEKWSYLHILLAVWIGSLAFEEFRQASISGTSFRSYIGDMWNVMDIISLSLSFVSIVLFAVRFVDSLVKQIFSATDEASLIQGHEFLIRLSRICACIALFILYVRIMQVFSIHVSLGPKVVMIQNMIVKDLLPFMVIFMVFVIGYGIIMWSILFPLHNPSMELTMTSIMDILKLSYFQVFGELKIDFVSGEISTLTEQCKTNLIGCPDLWGKWLAPILLGIYIVLTNVLLLNLLIAMFSNTYESIQGSALQHWTLQRYNIMREYTERSPICPPFIIIWHLIFTFYYLYNRCKGIFIFDNGPFSYRGLFQHSYKDNASKERQLAQWEHIRTVEFLRALDDPVKRKSNAQTVVVRGGGGNSSNGGGVNMKRELDSVQEGITEKFKESIRDVENHVKRLNAVETKLEELKEMIANLGVAMASEKAEIERRKKVFSTSETSPTTTASRASSVMDIRSTMSPFSIKVEEDFNIERRAWCIGIAGHKLARLIPYNAEGNEGHLWESIPWSDNENYFEIDFNSYDKKSKVNRISGSGQYEVNAGLPINPQPVDDIGSKGRGSFPLWGPNHIMHLLITRWKRDNKQNMVKKGTHKVLQALTIICHNNSMVFPWYFVRHGSQCNFKECLESPVRHWLKDLVDKVEKIQDSHTVRVQGDTIQAAKINLIYSGYLEDPSNLNNAWMETTVVNVHEHYTYAFDSDIIATALSHPNSGEQLVWVDVANRHLMRSSHNGLARMTAAFHGSYF